jgi:hypothetical protein
MEIGIKVAVRSGTEVTVFSALVILWCGLPPPGGGVVTLSVVSAAETLDEDPYTLSSSKTATHHFQWSQISLDIIYKRVRQTAVLNT